MMNVNNMLDWEQYVKQYVVVYQCQGAVLLQGLLPGDPREGHSEMSTREIWLSQGRKKQYQPQERQEESLIQPSSALSGRPELAGNRDLLHLPLEMNHLLKG